MKKNCYAILRYGFLLLICAVISGCGNDAASRDRKEEDDPALRRARVKKKAQDIDGAIELFNKAIERKPELARAHLEVGLLYDSYKEDYTRAMYHYQRYLELRPESEKRQLIEDLIRRARISFAASLPDTPSGAIEEIAELRRENDNLRMRLGDLMGRYEQLMQLQDGQEPPNSSGFGEDPRVRPAPAPAQPPVRTYRVQKGDTLSSISSKMYADSSRWRRIYDANRNVLKSPGSLKVGQTLVIPGKQD